MISTTLGFLGAEEMISIALALLLLFGGKKIPELMRGLGKGIREVKDAQNDDPEEKVKNEQK